jgi:putative N-acetyltransferase (TIGR04045 family)
MLPESIDPIPPFIPAEYRIRLADTAWERQEYLQLRRAVFAKEQRLFRGNDRDAHDTHATPIVAVACIAGIGERVVGAVRIHEDFDSGEPGIWIGSRLCVARDSRRLAFLSWGLIRLAVSTAHARGCRQFFAHVQEQNVALFEKLDWHAGEPVLLHGRPHRRMEADLAHYPPCADGELRPMPLVRLAA